MNNCSVCRHLQREEIEQALRTKLPLRQVAVRFGISKDAARRHLRHVAPQPDPLSAEIPPCSVHGHGPFRLEGSQWVCGSCSPWDGRGATYWKCSSATLAQQTET